MSRTKTTYQVRNASFHRVGDYWPSKANDAHADRRVMVCQSEGDCPIRGIKDGHEIRTSIIEHQSADGLTVETMNSIYKINKPKVSPEHQAAIDAGLTDEHHWCEAHKQVTGEGDICAECERLWDVRVAELNQAMAETQYSLYVCAQGLLFKVPVYNFNDAKVLNSSMIDALVTSSRIARYCTLEGCEVVLHKFK